MKQKKDIQNVELSFVCPQNWDSMTVCGNGRFCNVCQKIVYDFTDQSQKDYEKALRQHGGQMCGRFTKQQLTLSVNFAKVAALAALSFGVTEGSTQKVDSIPLPSVHQESTKEEIPFLGLILIPNPEFIGGTIAMFEFLRENIKYPQTCKNMNIDGTVYVGFVVKTDGQITDVKVKRGVHPDMDNEAIRAVKLMSGKWKPAFQNGQSLNTSYTLPIKFKLESEQTIQKTDSIPAPVMCGIFNPIVQKDKNGELFYGRVEDNPEFIDGQKALYQFIKDNLKNPSPELGCMEGNVYIGFIVETDGRLTDIQVKRSFHPDFSTEAVRVVNLMQGKWKAGKENGKPVRVAYTIPIKFRLE